MLENKPVSTIHIWPQTRLLELRNTCRNNCLRPQFIAAMQVETLPCKTEAYANQIQQHRLHLWTWAHLSAWGQDEICPIVGWAKNQKTFEIMGTSVFAKEDVDQLLLTVQKAPSAIVCGCTLEHLHEWCAHLWRPHWRWMINKSMSHSPLIFYLPFTIK